MQNDDNLYPLPFTIKYKLKLRTHLLYGFIIALFSAAMFIPVDTMKKTLYLSLNIILILFFLVLWILIVQTGKTHFLLDETGITCFGLFHWNKTIRWADVHSVKRIKRNHNDMIAIASKDGFKKYNGSVVYSLSEAQGGYYDLAILISFLHNINLEKLFATINVHVQNASKSDSEIPPKYTIIYQNPTQPDNQHTAIRFLDTFFISILAAIVYGFSILIWNLNVFAIPVLFYTIILALHAKILRENKSLLISILSAIICCWHAILAALVYLVVLNTDYRAEFGILRTVSACAEYIFNHPHEFLDFYIIAVILFAFTFLIGLPSNLYRKMKSPFIKRQNGFYVEKKRNSVTVYSIGYSDYDDKSEKMEITIFPNVCKIENERKKLLAFYIPKEIFDEIGIHMSKPEIVELQLQEYIKLGLGGQAWPKTYGYTCTLILNNNRQLEMIKINW